MTVASLSAHIATLWLAQITPLLLMNIFIVDGIDMPLNTDMYVQIA